jgi:hypothetical protein
MTTLGTQLFAWSLANHDAGVSEMSSSCPAMAAQGGGAEFAVMRIPAREGSRSVWSPG